MSFLPVTPCKSVYYTLSGPRCSIVYDPQSSFDGSFCCSIESLLARKRKIAAFLFCLCHCGAAEGNPNPSVRFLPSLLPDSFYGTTFCPDFSLSLSLCPQNSTVCLLWETDETTDRSVAKEERGSVKVDPLNSGRASRGEGLTKVHIDRSIKVLIKERKVGFVQPQFGRPGHATSRGCGRPASRWSHGEKEEGGGRKFSLMSCVQCTCPLRS